MRFQFEAIEKGKTRKGFLLAEDREDAFAQLESKGLRVQALQTALEQGDAGRSRESYIALALCTLGLLAMSWSALSGGLTGPQQNGQKPVLLQVEGSVRGNIQGTDRVSVLFPELPARIEEPWSEIGRSDGSYQLSRELTTFESPPLYFHVSITDAQGNVKVESERTPFDPLSGRGLAAHLTLE
jgi:hypothetical protein